MTIFFENNNTQTDKAVNTCLRIVCDTNKHFFFNIIFFCIGNCRYLKEKMLKKKKLFLGVSPTYLFSEKWS